MYPYLKKTRSGDDSFDAHVNRIMRARGGVIATLAPTVSVADDRIMRARGGVIPTNIPSRTNNAINRTQSDAHLETTKFLQYMIGDNPKVSIVKKIKEEKTRINNIPIYGDVERNVNIDNKILYDPSANSMSEMGDIYPSEKAAIDIQTTSNDGDDLIVNNMQELESLKSFFSRNLQKIEDSGNGGKRLLENLNNALHGGRQLKIELEKGKGWFFSPGKDGDRKDIVHLDISRGFLEAPEVQNNQIQSLNTTSFYGFVKRKSVIPANVTDGRERNVIASEQEHIPFYMALAHELNHFLHYGDGSNKDNLRSQKKIDDNSRVGNAKNLWDSEEEHRNVFSPIDPSSELNLRIEQKLPLRYPYASQSAFIEPVKTVIRSAIRSENPITGTTLNIADSREWLGKLKGLVDKLDKLPKTRVSNSKLSVLHKADTVDTNDSNSMQHTKIKLLPYLFGEDGYPFSTEQKQQIVESYTQHMRDKGKKRPWISFFDRFSKNKTEKQFNQMMSHIKSEQDEKISRDFNEQQANGLGKYSFIPRMLAQEIRKRNVQVKESSGNMAGNIIDQTRNESDLVALFTNQMRVMT